ncbi:hypothetical protein SK128_024914 [Halocaridina rubra]|uniref:Uncharacterized protein n=1 Tax=Halocaridina rubra TaxID=373956 RepID=A0AAN8XGV1_HALRR
MLFTPVPWVFADLKERDSDDDEDEDMKERNDSSGDDESEDEADEPMSPQAHRECNCCEFLIIRVRNIPLDIVCHTVILVFSGI